MASLGPPLGAPAGSPGQVKYTGGTGSGAWPWSLLGQAGSQVSIGLYVGWVSFAWRLALFTLRAVFVGCRADLLKAVETPQVQFLDTALTMTSCSFVGAKMQV